MCMYVGASHESHKSYVTSQPNTIWMKSRVQVEFGVGWCFLDPNKISRALSLSRTAHFFIPNNVWTKYSFGWYLKSRKRSQTGSQTCRHLTSPCQHHPELAPSLSTFRDRSSTRPPLEREAGQLLGQRKTYAMPWQTCLVCPHYPFPSLLLLDPPALWQPSPPVNHTTISHATPLQHHQSLLPDRTHQS